ncbi:carboxylesterase family protein [Kineosporia sp. NBRC 101731]|nr:carboxylesterase family protein [Kineosporia sp. NBRC 101731]
MSVVRFRGGAVRGLSRPGSTAFLGIPFAQAPVGERR